MNNTEILNKLLEEKEGQIIRMAELVSFVSANGHKNPRSGALSITRKLEKVERGVYKVGDSLAKLLPPSIAPEQILEATTIKNSGVISVSNNDIYVPPRDPNFIPWGEFKTFRKIIASRMFFPTYFSGMSGNGKTIAVEQACSMENREYIRIQISPETDEDDLIGGFRLIDGETVFQKGPVVKAMEQGSILLMDEIDRGTNKIMCLQGILEGKPVLLKKTGEVISPAPGFNIIATGNTKGQGDTENRYVAAGVIDDAFLERFVCLINQEFPSKAIEKKILVKLADSIKMKDEEFIDKLISWSHVIRQGFKKEAIDDLISTRRLCHIIKAMVVFEDRKISINNCINRFDDEIREAFLDLYEKIDESMLDEEGNPRVPFPEESPF